MARVFLLSPARLDGIRARSLFAPREPRRDREEDATLTAAAAALRTREGAPIGEVFRRLSGLYFRGKLAYAMRFARPPSSSRAAWTGSGALIITANRGLVPAETRICLEHLEAFAETPIHHAEAAFRGPLVRDATMLEAALEQGDDVILLGSVAQAKYTEPLLEVFGERLSFPRDFVGRGDMSRGSLLLRAALAGAELPYAAVKGATVRGARPPKLTPRVT